MSVSTECSFQPESDWDSHPEYSSMINIDMSQPSSPRSPSKLFKVGFMFSVCVCIIKPEVLFELGKNRSCSNWVTVSASLRQTQILFAAVARILDLHQLNTDR